MGWLRDTWRELVASPLRIGMVLGALAVGIIAGLPASEAGFDYVWRDPAFCDDCHIHDYANEAWARSVHAELTTCHDCHRVPLSHYPRNLVGVAEGPRTPDEMGRAHVETVICEQCHRDTTHDEPLTGPMSDVTRSLVVKVDDSRLHRVHFDAENDEPIQCVDCHGAEFAEAHRFEPVTDACLDCHEGHRPSGERLSHAACRECHFSGFLGRTPDGPKPP